MNKRVVYLHELSQHFTDSHQGTVDSIRHCLRTFFQSVIKRQGPSTEYILPSIADFADQLCVPKDVLLQGLRRVKEQDGVNVEFKSGYYGSLMLNT